MNEKIDLNLIRRKLPDNGMKLIEEKTKYSRGTISRYFNGKPVKASTGTLILDAALEVIQEATEKSRYRMRQVKKLMTEEDTQTEIEFK